MWDTRFVLDLVDAVYLASVLGNRPRPIDRHIDYFGEKITVFKDSVDGDQATVHIGADVTLYGNAYCSGNDQLWMWNGMNIGDLGAWGMNDSVDSVWIN